MRFRQGLLKKRAFVQTLTTKSVDFSAEAVYFMRVLVGFSSQDGKNPALISRYSGK